MSAGRRAPGRTDEQTDHEEHRLYKHGAVHDKSPTRAKAIEIARSMLELRQRRAARKFGENPDDAEVRNPGTVDRYEGQLVFAATPFSTHAGT